jgi:hypothetical protein
MVQYFQRKESQTEEARIKTRRGRLLTTLPRIIQLDMLRVNTTSQRKEIFGTDDFTNGTNLQILKIKAGNKNQWDKIVHTMTKYEEIIWHNRNNERKRVATTRTANQESTTTQRRGRGRPRGSGRGRGSQGRRSRNTPSLQRVKERIAQIP